MTDLLPPGNVPAWADADPANQIAQIWAGDMWPALWPRMIHTYADAAARDADLAGLGPSDPAFAFVQDKGWLTRWTGTVWRPIGPVSGIATNVTFTAGLANVTHNLGFAPSFVMIMPQIGASLIHVLPTTAAASTTTKQVRGFDSTGAALAGNVSTVGWVAWA